MWLNERHIHVWICILVTINLYIFYKLHTEYNIYISESTSFMDNKAQWKVWNIHSSLQGLSFGSCFSWFASSLWRVYLMIMRQKQAVWNDPWRSTINWSFQQSCIVLIQPSNNLPWQNTEEFVSLIIIFGTTMCHENVENVFIQWIKCLVNLDLQLI